MLLAFAALQRTAVQTSYVRVIVVVEEAQKPQADRENGICICNR
jgi:hypothetical protein